MNISRKITAVLLALIVVVCSAVPAFAEVEYPDGLSKTTVAGSITKLDGLTLKLISDASEKSLRDIVYSAFISDSTLNSLFAAVYGEFAGKETTLANLGVNVSPAGLAACLSAYPSVSKAVAGCPDLKTAVDYSASFRWGVSDKNGFASACAAMFSPFDGLLYTLLCSGSVQINNYISVKGADGYTNAIVPILDAIECPAVMSQADYTEAASKSRSAMVKNIVNMLFASIDVIIDAPVNGLTDLLPHLAYYLQNGGLSTSLNTLLSPLSLKIGIFTIPGISSLFGGIENIESSASLSSLLSDVDLSKITGSDTQISLPEVDLGALAACGSTDENGNFVADKADALVTVFYWLLDTLKQNSAELTSSLGTDAAEMITPLLQKDNQTLLKAVFVLLTAGDTPRNKVAIYSYPEVERTAVEYPEGLTEDNMEAVVSGIDDLIEEILKEEDKNAELSETIKKTIYSSKTAAMLVKGIYSALSDEQIAGVMDFLGIGVSTASVSYSFSAYRSASGVMRSAPSWAKLDESKLDFGFKDGDKKAFRKVIVTALTPFEDLLSFALAGDTINIAGAIDIRGTNGYSTVVIPLLEALGCDNQTISAYSAYGRTKEAVITDIIDPLLSLVDNICDRPVEMLCSILPNIIYFLDSGILPEMLNNLIYPVTSLLEDAGLGDMLPADMFGGLNEFDLNSLLADFDASALGLDIKLPQSDITMLKTLGSPEMRVSKMSSNGSSISYTYIIADRAGVMMTLLRYIVGALAMEENSSLLSGFMSSDDPNDMMAMYAGNITEKFAGMTTDEIIVWLYNLFFREKPQVEIENTVETIPTVIYDPDNSLSAWQITGIFIGVILLALLTVWILLQLGYLEELQAVLDKKRHKREKKKQDRQKARQLAEMEKARNRTNIIYSSQLDGAGNAGMRVSGNKPVPAAKSGPAATAAPKQAVKPTAPVSRQSVVKPSSNPLLSEKQNLKYLKQQEKASKKALKNTKKADKYYREALKKSMKQ